MQYTSSFLFFFDGFFTTLLSLIDLWGRNLLVARFHRPPATSRALIVELTFLDPLRHPDHDRLGREGWFRCPE